MKISAINNYYSPKVNKTSFKGAPVLAPQITIHDYNDAIEQWKMLKHPQYTNVYQETEEPTIDQVKRAEEIRRHNYAFLDQLHTTHDKEMFIKYFQSVTGFPSLSESSQKIRDEFSRTIQKASDSFYVPPRLVMNGYDRFCSVGLDAAIPGSDLDKGYAILSTDSSDPNFDNIYKNQIWNNIDTRIMSVNHCAAFPNIMTLNELQEELTYFDEYAKKFVTPDNYNYFLYQRLNNPNPISSAKFNIFLSQQLSDTDKVRAKNLAYVVEAIRDGEQMYLSDYETGDLNNMLENSIFGWLSNVTQGYQMERKYETTIGAKKKKLQAREKMEKDFPQMPINTKYELVTDVIKGMSGDNCNPKFKDIFYSKTDKLRLLLNDILVGKVDCAFDTDQYGYERAHLFFNDVKCAPKYMNINIYTET